MIASLRKLADRLGLLSGPSPLVQQADAALDELHQLNKEVRRVRERATGNFVADMARGVYEPQRRRKPC